MLVDVAVHSDVLCESSLLETKNMLWALASFLSPTAAPDCNFGDGPQAVDEAVVRGRFGTNNLTYFWRRSRQISDQVLRIAAVKL